MRKVLLLLALGSVILMFASCSDSPTVPQSTVQQITLVQRPEFIETRPPDVVSQFIMKEIPTMALDKKPPPPPGKIRGSGAGCDGKEPLRRGPSSSIAGVLH